MQVINKWDYDDIVLTVLPLFLSFFPVWPLLPADCRCRGIRLLFIILNDTRSHTQAHTHKIGRITLDEGSARIRYLYHRKHNTHKGETSMISAEFEPANPASERPQARTLDREAFITVKRYQGHLQLLALCGYFLKLKISQKQFTKRTE